METNYGLSEEEGEVIASYSCWVCGFEGEVGIDVPTSLNCPGHCRKCGKKIEEIRPEVIQCMCGTRLKNL